MLWMLEDQNPDARFTTMFDLYGLPHDFPGYEESTGPRDPDERVRILEDSLRENVADSRFIPYVQLHEFEALLLADPQKLDSQFYEDSTGIQRLVQMANGFMSPELIDDGPDSAPWNELPKRFPSIQEARYQRDPSLRRGSDCIPSGQSANISTHGLAHWSLFDDSIRFMFHCWC